VGQLTNRPRGVPREEERDSGWDDGGCSNSISGGVLVRGCLLALAPMIGILFFENYFGFGVGDFESLSPCT